MLPTAGALSASGPPLGAGPIAFYVGASLAAVVIALIVGVSYAFADKVVAFLGQARSRVAYSSSSRVIAASPCAMA